MTSTARRHKAALAKNVCHCGVTKAVTVTCTKPANPEFCERFQELNLNEEHLQVFMRKMSKEIDNGLSFENHESAPVKCFVTHFQTIPTGNECGEFLIMDVSACSLRIVFVSIKPKKKPCAMEKIFEISKTKRVNSGENLFDYFAECLVSFITDHGLEEKILPLGFSFNFPVQPEGETKGYLSRWVKGFSCSDVEREDVVNLLYEALCRLSEITIEYIVILNDTIGTFMCGAHCIPKTTQIGLTIGERCNACYMECQENAEMFSDTDSGSGMVLINTEWSAFGENGQLDYMLTDYDRTMDKLSSSPGLETFEKIVSYNNLGELVRLVLVRLAEEGILFCGKPSEELLQCGSFKTDYISQIEYDPPGRFEHCKNILNCKLNLRHHKERDYINVRYICECFVRRAARLIAAGVATLLTRIQKPKVTVAVDGILFKSHPYFPLIMHETIAELVPPEMQFELHPVEDGAGIGNAIALAVTMKQNSKSSSSRNVKGL